MVDRVAVLADVHCVLPALEAVLAEPDVRAADLIVLAGDVAAGPQPVETVDLLASLGERVVWVRGNCERTAVDWARGGNTPDDPRYAMGVWAAGQLRPDQVRLLDGLPSTVTLDVRGLGEVLFCHATPRDDEEYVLVDSSLDRWTEVLAGVPETVTTVVCGHTHMPFLRLVDRRTVVNPGSVGMPYGTTGAHWALLGGDGPAIRLRRTEFDVEAACAAITAGSGFPEIEEWVEDFVRHPASDVEALGVFRARTTAT
ncbi:MAG TPA: metallophosphoesterase family protein [Actinophytocola sp.]|uniref:metallophosphoesterase family protein n=1 Tax=Actinophytocola sp. TaxID=1872138 RepID=UPI002DDD9067|nr:metallophosphoesterase family protein [Actinophytocola sp.]HEV2779655.1 metallophosphoesterase family protein [Actinophytocola sp.]